MVTAVALFSDKHLNYALRHRPDKFHTLISQPEIVRLCASFAAMRIVRLTITSVECASAVSCSFASGELSHPIYLLAYCELITELLPEAQLINFEIVFQVFKKICSEQNQKVVLLVHFMISTCAPRTASFSMNFIDAIHSQAGRD
jgi:hypothetical protein